MNFLSTSVDVTNLPQPAADTSTVTTVMSIFFVTLGLISLLVIVIAGFTFITSNGDPQRAMRSRNAIFYALIGLGIAIFAQTIVEFVIGRFA